MTKSCPPLPAQPTTHSNRKTTWLAIFIEFLSNWSSHCFLCSSVKICSIRNMMFPETCPAIHNFNEPGLLCSVGFFWTKKNIVSHYYFRSYSFHRYFVWAVWKVFVNSNDRTTHEWKVICTRLRWHSNTSSRWKSILYGCIWNSPCGLKN